MKHEINDFSFYRLVERDIETKGFHLVVVKDASGGELYAYTIGLVDTGKPEILFFNSKATTIVRLLHKINNSDWSTDLISAPMLLKFDSSFFSISPLQEDRTYVFMNLAHKFYSLRRRHLSMNAVLAVGKAT